MPVTPEKSDVFSRFSWRWKKNLSHFNEMFEWFKIFEPKKCPKALPSWWRFFYKAVDLEWQSPAEIGGSEETTKWIKFDTSGGKNHNTPPKKRTQENEGIEWYRRCIFFQRWKGPMVLFLVSSWIYHLNSDWFTRLQSISTDQQKWTRERWRKDTRIG